MFVLYFVIWLAYYYFLSRQGAERWNAFLMSCPSRSNLSQFYEQEENHVFPNIRFILIFTLFLGTILNCCISLSLGAFLQCIQIKRHQWEQGLTNRFKCQSSKCSAEYWSGTGGGIVRCQILYKKKGMDEWLMNRWVKEHCLINGKLQCSPALMGELHCYLGLINSGSPRLRLWRSPRIFLTFCLLLASDVFLLDLHTPPL